MRRPKIQHDVLRTLLIASTFLSVAACSEDFEQRQQYTDKLSNLDGANIYINRQVNTTWDDDTCPISIAIEITNNGDVRAAWIRPTWDDEGFEFPCVGRESAPTILREIEIEPSKHKLKRIKASLARLPWRTELGDPKEGEFALPDGCNLIMHGETSSSIWIDKLEKTSGFLVQEGCHSNQTQSAQLLIDDAIKSLLQIEDLLP